MALVVRPSRIHSAGVFTTTPVRKGARIVEYAGPRITPEEANRLYDGAPRTYLFGLEDGKTIIDGEGLGAYLNHSCDPNCEIDEIKQRAWIFALRDIAAGEELLWDYNLYDDVAPAPCHCGSRKCRGTMYSREWMARMRRQTARRKNARGHEKASSGQAKNASRGRARRQKRNTQTREAIPNIATY
ncbi:MAG: SET domain-containing protein-lysine N-methyltransferase [Candidatus Sulfotelmatobacter sp.]